MFKKETENKQNSKPNSLQPNNMELQHDKVWNVSLKIYILKTIRCFAIF